MNGAATRSSSASTSDGLREGRRRRGRRSGPGDRPDPRRRRGPGRSRRPSGQGSTGEVTVAVEISSPGSRRTDRVAKLAEYAEAGIASYVIVDPDGPLDEFVLDGGVYRLVAIHAGTAALAFGPTITLPV